MYAHVNGVGLFFDIEGGGYVPDGLTVTKKPTLVLLHGGPGFDHSYFKPWLLPLTGQAQLVFVDHRGNGRSGRVDEQTYTIEQMADDLEALRHHLGLGPIMVLGHSFGGMVAQVYALRYPQSLSKLILSNSAPSVQFMDEALEIVQKIATPEQLAALPAMFEGMLTSQEQFDRWWETCMPLYFHNPDSDTIAQVQARMHGEVVVANYIMANEIPSYDVRAGLASVTVPTLVIAGRHDWVTPVSQSQAILDALPGAQLVVQENSGHMGFIEETEGYLAAVRAFI
jgi:proline iminopeptidase